MNSKWFDYGLELSMAQSDPYLDPLSIFVFSIHLYSHHHEHPAH